MIRPALIAATLLLCLERSQAQSVAAAVACASQTASGVAPTITLGLSGLQDG